MDVSREIRHILVAHHQAGHSWRRIALMMNMPKTTVRNILKQYTETGSVLATRVGRCGRPRSLSIRSERALARASVVNPKLTAREIRSSVGGEVALLSISTIQSALRHQGRNAYRPRKSPSLNAAQRNVRLQWCRKYSSWDVEQWIKVRGYIRFLMLKLA
jgi:transposase